MEFAFKSPKNSAYDLSLKVIKRNGFETVQELYDRERNSGTAVCVREELALAVRYDQQNELKIISMVPFGIMDDSVQSYNDPDEIADLKAQLHGIFSGWQQRGILELVDRTSDSKDDLFKGTERILGRKEIRLPSWTDTVDYFKEQPILRYVVVLITGAVLVYLVERLMKFLLPWVAFLIKKGELARAVRGRKRLRRLGRRLGESEG